MSKHGNQRYVNAEYALPKDLYEKVKRHLAGRLVWFPGECGKNLEVRNEYVRKLRAENQTVSEIADRLGLSARHVWRILARRRAVIGNDGVK